MRSGRVMAILRHPNIIVQDVTLLLTFVEDPSMTGRSSAWWWTCGSGVEQTNVPGTFIPALHFLQPHTGPGCTPDYLLT